MFIIPLRRSYHVLPRTSGTANEDTHFFFVIVVFLISINVFHIDFSEYIGIVAVHYPIHLQLVSCYGFLA